MPYKICPPQEFRALPVQHASYIRLAVLWGWLAHKIGLSLDDTLKRSGELL